MKVPLVSAFLEDDVYETRLTDKFMEEVICMEDHFYHRTAKALSNKNIEPVVYYLSQEKEIKEFTHKYGHKIIRVPAKRMNFIHEPIVYSSKLIESIKNYEICDFVSGYYINCENLRDFSIKLKLGFLQMISILQLTDQIFHSIITISVFLDIIEDLSILLYLEEFQSFF